MKSMQPMTVSRHVQSVRSVHRRGTYRKSGFVIGRYGNTIRRTRRRRSTLHSLSRPSFSFVSTRFLLSLSRNVSLSPDHCPPTFSSPKKKSASARISASSSTPKTEYHFASRHGAQPADCVPHETLYLAAFVSPTSEKSCREFTYLLPPANARFPFLFSLSLSLFLRNSATTLDLERTRENIRSCFHLRFDLGEFSGPCEYFYIELASAHVHSHIRKFNSCRSVGMDTRRHQARPGSVSSPLIRNTVFFTRYGYPVSVPAKSPNNSRNESAGKIGEPVHSSDTRSRLTNEPRPSKRAL